MKQDITEKITVPDGVNVSINKHLVSIQGKHGSQGRNFIHPTITIDKKNNSVILNVKNGTLREKRLIKTFKSHIINMIHGSNEGYTYELKICSMHFPMTVTVEGNELIIKNFIGEKKPRRSKIINGVKVRVNGDKIICEGHDKEKTGQTAANIELATRIRNKDRRIFQDGCYQTIKAGKPIGRN